MNPSTPQDQLIQALQGLLQGGQPKIVQQSDQTQSFDPNQLYTELVSRAIQSQGSGRKYNFNIPQDTNIHPMLHEGQHPIESQATTQAIHNGADPSLLDKARQYLGKNAYIGLCEAFVERMTQGAEGIYRSAIDAWNQHQGNRQTDLSKAQPGDAIYFAADASNRGFGHTGVYMGNGKFISATDNGIRQYDLNDWQKRTGQKVLGYVPKDQRIIKSRDQLYPQQSQQPMQQSNISTPIVNQQRPIPSAPIHVQAPQQNPLNRYTPPQRPQQPNLLSMRGRMV